MARMYSLSRPIFPPVSVKDAGSSLHLLKLHSLSSKHRLYHRVTPSQICRAELRTVHLLLKSQYSVDNDRIAALTRWICKSFDAEIEERHYGRGNLEVENATVIQALRAELPRVQILRIYGSVRTKEMEPLR